MQVSLAQDQEVVQALSLNAGGTDQLTSSSPGEYNSGVTFAMAIGVSLPLMARLVAEPGVSQEMSHSPCKLQPNVERLNEPGIYHKLTLPDSMDGRGSAWICCVQAQECHMRLGWSALDAPVPIEAGLLLFVRCDSWQ
jgi:hypothetical protein